MIKQLRVRNFKAWRDTGEIRLAPLTVLFGNNSAGKTSIPQLLLMLKQTAASSDRSRALHLGDQRNLVDLGSYVDVVHGHDLKQPLSFELTWDVVPPLEVVDPLHSATYTGDSVRFAATMEADDAGQPRVRTFTFSLLDDDDVSMSLGITPTGKKYKITASTYNATRQTGRPWPLTAPRRFYGFPAETQVFYQNLGFTSDLEFSLEALLGGLFYVGPLREHPRRTYLWSGEIPDHVGERGDRAIEALLAGNTRRLNFNAKAKTKTLPELVAEWLRDMGLIAEFEIEPLAKNRKEYEVRVRTRPSGPWVNLTDVGFGVSQVLPVIVECFYVPARSVVVFEQPEIHLHPRVQADLASFFVEAVKAREAGQPRDCQFIIESHSEHFLRRLQRKVAEEAISSADVALYFVTSRAGEAVIEELQLDEYGNIGNWPQDFFGDEMADYVARTQAEARRRAADAG